MCTLYSFMRLSDDIGDEPATSDTEKQTELAQWRATLETILTNNYRPENHANHNARYQIFPALNDMIQRHEIPGDYFRIVLDGIASDLQPRTFDTFAELSQYCYQVAGVVGLCCIHIWGFHNPAAIDRAIDCGLAFQLTNILRDLAEDAEMGRLYLPMEDCRRFQYDENDIAAHRQNESFRQLMTFEVERAETYYRKAEELFDMLDPSGQPMFAGMHRAYGRLLQKIKQRNYDVFTQRITLSKWQKLRTAAGTFLRYRLFSTWKVK